MNYKEAVAYLSDSMKFGSRLGLERMTRLIELLGFPAQDISFIHIAGTNGKGSTASFTASILAADGNKVGIFTSPFIQRFTERIRVINGREGLLNLSDNETEGEISKDKLALYVAQIKEQVDIMLSEGWDHPTEFELITAAGFIYFAQERCDYIVLETGLGGRLDSTNIIKNPLKCIITAIGYDHTERLGSTIREIAFEKAGIIKENSDVIMFNPQDYSDPEDAKVILAVFQSMVTAKKARSFIIKGLSDIIPGNSNIKNQSFAIRLNKKTLEVTTSLIGDYQRQNCILAATACSDLVKDSSIITGIKYTKWPGRLEVLSPKNPIMILDGAHNLQGAKLLRTFLEEHYEDKKIVFLCGFMKDKDFKNMLNTILSSSKYTILRVYCVRPNNERAIASDELANFVREILDKISLYSYNKLVEVIAVEEASLGARKTFMFAKDNDAIAVAFGSLYMAGDIREAISAEEKE